MFRDLEWDPEWEVTPPLHIFLRTFGCRQEKTNIILQCVYLLRGKNGLFQRKLTRDPPGKLNESFVAAALAGLLPDTRTRSYFQLYSPYRCRKNVIQRDCGRDLSSCICNQKIIQYSSSSRCVEVPDAFRMWMVTAEIYQRTKCELSQDISKGLYVELCNLSTEDCLI